MKRINHSCPLQAIRTEIQEQLKLIEEEGNVFDTFMASSEEELKGLKEKLVEMDETLGTYQQQLNENGVRRGIWMEMELT